MNEETKNVDILDISATVPAAGHTPDASTLIGEMGPWPLPALRPIAVAELPALDEAPAQTRPRKKKVTTLHLNSRTCRWPIGDPVQADFHYCGDLPMPGRNYCDKHDAMSFQPASRRRSS